MINVSKIEPKEIMEGFLRRFIRTEHLTLAYWNIEEETQLPLHSHHHEQITQVTKGKFELTVDGVIRLGKEGEIVVIPSHVENRGIALTPCEIFNIFSPVRKIIDNKNISNAIHSISIVLELGPILTLLSFAPLHFSLAICDCQNL